MIGIIRSIAVNRVALHGPRPGSQVEIDPEIEI
jgi:hypothetical protein